MNTTHIATDINMKYGLYPSDSEIVSRGKDPKKSVHRLINYSLGMNSAI